MFEGPEYVNAQKIPEDFTLSEQAAFYEAAAKRFLENDERRQKQLESYTRQAIIDRENGVDSKMVQTRFDLLEIPAELSEALTREIYAAKPDQQAA